MKAQFIYLLVVLTFPQFTFAQEDPYDIGWNPNGYLRQQHTVEYCVEHHQYQLEHLWVKTERSYQLFQAHAQKFSRIDSLTIGDNLFCAVIKQLEHDMLKNAGELPDLPELKFLSINMLSMENPFKNLGKLEQLKYLEIGGSFTHIPHEVWGLTQLEHLNLYGHFKTVSPEINQLRQLKSLVLQGKYTKLPNPIRPLPKLEYLNISGDLAETPDYLKYCPNLRFFEMISDIPMRVTSNIGRLTKLEVLILTNNVILNFSDDISKLQTLRELHLSCTWLNKFPAGICKLASLEELRLDVMCLDEQLEDYYGKTYAIIPTLHIPSTIQQLPKLEWIDLIGRKVPEADIQLILKAFPDAAIEYGPWE
ncbi:MAG: leucine-rich repeat domain-containing protein [Flammeovirgaceae bacterium]